MIIINSLVNILGFLWMYFMTYIKYIGIAILICFIVIWILKTKSINKIFKIILIAIISVGICIMLSNYSNKTIDAKYIEMKKMVDNKSLIGLSEEVVIELLGEPRYKYTDRENKANYIYFAGTIREEWLWGECYSTKYYELRIEFDEGSKVEYSYIKEST